MSTPVDFVGLNTLVKKTEGPNKNEITSIDNLKSFRVNQKIGTERRYLTDYLVYENFDQFKNFHLVDDKLSNCSIEIRIASSSFGDNEGYSFINAYNQDSSLLSSGYVNPYNFQGILHIAQPPSVQYHQISSSVSIKTGVANRDNIATIVFHNNLDRNLHKRGDSGKNETEGKRMSLYVNGELTNLQDSLLDNIFNFSPTNENTGSIPIVQFGRGYNFAVAFSGESGEGETPTIPIGETENSEDSVLKEILGSEGPARISSIVFWKQALTTEEVKLLSSKEFDYFAKINNNILTRDNRIPIESYIETSLIPEKDFSLFYSSEVSNGISNNQIGEISETNDLFSALMNNINGPYGYSSFKQLRASQNWLVRAYNKNNTFSFVSENGETITVTKDGKILSTHTKKYGEIQNLTENPVTNQHEPLEMVASVIDEETQDFEKLSIKGTFSNDTQYFKNEEFNNELGTKTKQSLSFDDFKAIYEEKSTPVDEVEKITYRQTIYPRNLYTYSKNHRSRPDYSSKVWRDLRSSRTELDVNNGFGYHIQSQSFWPLDAEENFTTLPASNSYGGAFGYNSTGGAGILQNSYSLFATSSNQSKFSGVDVDSVVSASILYSRPHTLTSSTSVVNPFFTTLSGGAIGNCLKFTGHAKWEAGDMAGFFNTTGAFQLSPKKPFPDSYDEWSESFRGLGKDYSIVPEFRISDHVGHYLTKGFTSQRPDFLEVRGGNSSYKDSSTSDFYKIYSTSDFLKNFDVVKDNLKNKMSPSAITLRCKAIKKFLPYEGFYPCQRTVDVAKQFYDSYGFFVQGSSWNTHLGGYAVSGAVASVTSTSKYASQNLMTPLFSPGILFNSIKSGIACDFPVFDYPYITGSAGEEFFISSDTSKRIPFEALMEPEKHLANFELHSMEPDLQSPKVKSIWIGQGDNLYKLMINNFVSEVGDFFLENERHTTITSLPEGDPNFGNVQPGKIYGMRVKMFRSITGSKGVFTDHEGDTYGIPQDNGDMGESFTMYSRPSAFGPPLAQIIPAAIGNHFKAKNWSDFKFSGSIDFSYPGPEGSAIIAPGYSYYESGSNQGYNWTYTPPYYHGEAWADVFFQPPEGAKKYSLSEIINNSSVEFLRHYTTSSQTINTLPSGISFPSLLINDQAMQIPSSMNLFSRGIIQEDSSGLTINTQLETKYRWIIQSKWETPLLNFNHYTHEDLTMPTNTIKRSSTPIGMWHQYGRLPQRTDEGVFVQVTDIPSNWIEGAMQGTINTTGSLVDLCGFSSEPIRVGEIKNTKMIEESVVAIPFIERDGFKNFFNIKKKDVENSLNGNKNLAGDTVNKLVDQLNKYVFPPQFDFIRNQDIQPFAMYVFEFSHNLTKQDLSDIWQNLPPKLGDIHETAEATVSHNLFAQEFLGKGATIEEGTSGDPNTSKRLDKITELSDLPTNIQWMVFKVKKRAKSNYFEKMFQRNESRDTETKDNFTVDSTGKKSDVSYNWPYDFFSMVELIKLDAEVEFSNVDQEKSELNNKKVIKPYKINKE